MALVRFAILLILGLWWVAYQRHPENWFYLVAALFCTLSWLLFELDRGRRTVNKMIEGDDPLDPR